MDMFPERTASSGCAPGQVVDYFDGNTVTALWNYAQHFAMSDNSFNTTFGPSSPGAVNLISGQTHGVVASLGNISGDVVDGTLLGDADPLYEDCGSPAQVGLGGKNIGDLLNEKNISWGWLKGASAIATRPTRPATVACAKTTSRITSHFSTTPPRQIPIIFRLALSR
jgi:phospholipase C